MSFVFAHTTLTYAFLVGTEPNAICILQPRAPDVEPDPAMASLLPADNSAILLPISSTLLSSHTDADYSFMASAKCGAAGKDALTKSPTATATSKELGYDDQAILAVCRAHTGVARL